MKLERFPNLSTELRKLPPPPPQHPAWTPETTALFKRNGALTAQAMVDNLNRKTKNGDQKP